MVGDMDYYWKLLEEMQNDYLSGNERYLKLLDEAYTLMSDCKHDPHRYGGSVGGSSHTGVVFSEVGDKEKEKNIKVIWEFGDPTPLHHRCPVFRTKTVDK